MKLTRALSKAGYMKYRYENGRFPRWFLPRVINSNIDLQPMVAVMMFLFASIGTATYHSIRTTPDLAWFKEPMPNQKFANTQTRWLNPWCIDYEKIEPPPDYGWNDNVRSNYGWRGKDGSWFPFFNSSEEEEEPQEDECEPQEEEPEVKEEEECICDTKDANEEAKEAE